MESTTGQNKRALNIPAPLYTTLLLILLSVPVNSAGSTVSDSLTSNVEPAGNVCLPGAEDHSMRGSTQSRSSRVLTGLASYYGPRFHGRVTANGERFDQDRLTAAHPSLPFGTELKVKNLRNGKVVRLRVNDRGPYISGRSLDVSMGAAKLLGFLKEGVVPVEMTILAKR